MALRSATSSLALGRPYHFFVGPLCVDCVEEVGGPTSTVEFFNKIRQKRPSLLALYNGAIRLVAAGRIATTALLLLLRAWAFKN
jgi:hypothetical protein